MTVEEYRKLPKKRVKRKPDFDGEAAIRSRLQALNVHFEEQYYFAKSVSKRYRADFCVFDSDSRPVVLIEYEGGVWVQSGHTTGTGVNRDAKKANLAQVLGYRHLRFTKDLLKDPTYFEEMILKALD